MTLLHLPWLELSLVTCLVGAGLVARDRDPDRRRTRAVVASGVALVCMLGAFVDFLGLGAFEAHDRWDLLHALLGRDLLVVDELNAPLLPLAALTFFLTILSTLRTSTRRFSFPHALVAEAVTLATLSVHEESLLVALLVAGALLPLHEQRRKGRSVRLLGLHLAAFAGLLLVGHVLHPVHAGAGLGLLALALLVRTGVLPGHLWVIDLFERGSVGTAILFLTPMVGIHAFLRLVLPEAGPALTQGLAALALVSAAYFSGMALVQATARRFFACELLCHTSLVLLGLTLGTPLGVTGALSVWLSVGLALTGFGLTLRCVEARLGRLRLDRHHGLHPRMPMLATFFLVMGLASVGFPGTIGFVAAELLVEAGIDASGWLGAGLVFVAALNGLAVLHAYFRVFAGPPHPATVDLRSRTSERLAILVLTLLVLGGGLVPQPGIASRHHAALEFLELRAAHGHPHPPFGGPALHPSPASSEGAPSPDPSAPHDGR